MNIVPYIPNAITVLRCLLCPFVCYFLFTNSILAFIFFVVAAVSDFFDGFLARRFECESDFGNFFDNVADKLLIISVLCSLLALQEVMLVPCIIIISREVIVSSFREYIIQISNSHVKVDILGKIKTFIQFIAIGTLLFPIDFFEANSLNFIGNILLLLSAAMSLISGGYYFVKYFLKKA